jgi:hypothetical protein
MALIVALVTMTAMGQQLDVLGAHNMYGRGCVACHAPHSGSFGNGVTPKKGDPGTGNIALWGQDLSPLYGQTVAFGDSGKYSVTLPGSIAGFTGASDPNFVIIACLSCHDGNLAKVGWMTGQTVETLPVVGGHAPTWLGSDGSTVGNYNNDHPVGPAATFGCNTPPPGQTFGESGYNWDCSLTVSNGKVTVVPGPNMTNFENNYGFTVSLTSYTPSGGTTVPIVTCTGCHNQHSNYIYNGKIGGVTAYWNTSFFIRGPYTPAASGGSVVNNTAAQFCRNCHGGESNEMSGLEGVPTTGTSHQ